jgi:hypothetical protein
MRLLYPLLALASLAGAADIELSPSGPLKTPQAALEAARAAKKPVRVLVADGTYAMTGPLTLGPEDSGVTWETAPGAKPVFTGGRELTGWTEVEKGLWKAPIPDKNWNFEQLWVNGRRAVRARTPNHGYRRGRSESPRKVAHAGARLSALTPLSPHGAFACGAGGGIVGRNQPAGNSRNKW